MAEQLVVDANVVAKLYLRKADLLFSRLREREVRPVAPRLITYEVPAVVKRGAARGKAIKGKWQAARSSFESLELTICDDSDAKQEAVRLALNYGCSYYDALWRIFSIVRIS